MAFKPLEIYKESHIDTAISSSLLGISNGFCITINKNRFWDLNSPFWRLGTTFIGFNGIMLENLALNFQTSWSDAGGAILGKR